MKTFTQNQFVTLLNSAQWSFETGWDAFDNTPIFEYSDDGEELEVGETCNRCAWVTATTVVDGEHVEISYCEGVSFPQFKPDEYETSTDGINDVWTFNFAVTDEDGDALRICEIASIIQDSDEIEEGGRFSQIDYQDILPEIELEEIDTDEDTDMNTITVQRDNDRDIRFVGDRIASAASSADRAMGSSYSGSTGRWTELKLYKTASGKFICSSIGRTQWQGEHDRYSGAVCETETEVIEFFGNGWLAKELYEDAGIDCVIDVE